MKKIFIATALMLSFVPTVMTGISPAISVAAESEIDFNTSIEYNDMKFNFREDKTNELMFSQYLGADETVIIPETVQGYPVTAIDSSAFQNYKYFYPNVAKHVVLPDSIDFIESRAFQSSNLISVNIPKNLKIIPCNTFSKCPNLETVIFHDNIIGIAENAFDGTNIEIPPDILVSKNTDIFDSYYPFYMNKRQPFVSDDFNFHFNTDRETGDMYCSLDGYNGDSNDIIIPEKYRGVSVRNIDLSSSVHDISKITSVTFPDTDTEISIENNSFSGSMIESLNIKSPCSIGKNAFADCKELKKIVFDKNAVIDNETFIGCNSLNTVDFKGDTSIFARGFRECTNLTNVNFYKSADLNAGAFMDCTSLENISIDLSQNIMGNNFDGCTSLFNINNKPVFNTSTGEIFPEYNDFIRNSFYMAEDIGFINQFAETEYKKIVDENIDNSMSDVEKVKVLHDWVCEHTQYADDLNKPEFHTDASILMNDSTVCEGYAKACNLLFNYAGIETYYVFSSSHAWNIVKLGGHYFHIDSTWDDGENISYDHFMISDNDILDESSHNEWSISKPTSLHEFQNDKLPECNYSVGDTNMDGAFSIADAVKLDRFLLGSEAEKEENAVLYDMNYDGETDVFDMIVMRKKLVEN